MLNSSALLQFIILLISFKGIFNIQSIAEDFLESFVSSFLCIYLITTKHFEIITVIKYITLF